MAVSSHIKPISTLHLAWAAGFIEGEGSFSSCVTAAQVQKEPIDRLQNLFGGRVSQRFTKGFGSQPIWVWTLPVRRSMEVMMTLYVLMSPRRKGQIEASLAKWKSYKRILKSHGSRICGNGHEIAGENVYITPGGHRKCRTCRINIKQSLRRRRALGIPAKKRENWEPSRGENHVSAKLNNREVIDIRAAISSGARQVDLARKYRVSRTLISAIKRGKHRV